MQTILTQQPAEFGTRITEAVRAFYEAHPYPRYPLLAKPLWQEGYLCSSGFSRALAGQPPYFGHNRTLIAGCGEILPYIVRTWEPRSTRVTAIDLSASSIQRARIRCLRTGKSVEWITGSLESWLPPQGIRPNYTHADAFGVLHHLAAPTQALGQLAGALVDGGTMRLMVYNTPARKWIRDLQRAFDLLGWRPDNAKSVKHARNLLRELGTLSPTLSQKLSAMGPSILDNETRFCDTFLHPRESRTSVSQWLNAAQRAGLRLVGVYDRYGEGDHLPNPMWAPPSVEVMERLANDALWEGNWEFFFIKNSDSNNQEVTSDVSKAGFPLWPRMRWSAPPRAWRSWDETRTVPLLHLWSLWQIFQQRVHGLSTLPSLRAQSNRALKLLAPKAAQRLARIGAILPDTVDTDWLSLLNQPLCQSPGVIETKMGDDSPNLAAIESLIRKRLTEAKSQVELSPKQVCQSALRCAAATTNNKIHSGS